MLASNISNIHTAYNFFAEPGETIWSSIDMKLNAPYFLIGFLEKEDQAWTGQTRLVWEVDQLKKMHDEITRDTSKKLTQVAIICPAWLTKLIGWKMFDLCEIAKMRINKDSELFYVFKTVDDYYLSNSKNQVNFQTATNRETVLAISIENQSSEQIC